jgi:hypothetical protein
MYLTAEGGSVAEATRDTIYVDIDDEITGIIDKVRSSDAKIIALVLPKRASVFQSIVNMKLLKRTTEQSKKHIVLITSEAGLLPLAGSVGIHVAKTLATKPEIPIAPIADDGREEMVEETASLDGSNPDDLLQTDATTPVGTLAGVGSVSGPLSAEEVETLELDDEEEAAAVPAPVVPVKNKKAKKDTKLKIPNFERFRLALILIIVIVIIVVLGGLYLGLRVLPKASIAIQTDASNINTSVSFTLDPNATSLNAVSATVPAKQASEQKTYSATVAATGQQNNGQEASGTISMTAQECNVVTTPDDVPAGSAVTANGNTYITQGDTSFSETSIKHGCIYFVSSTGPTGITAQKPGAAFNTDSSNTTFSVAGRTDVSASGSANGGSDDIQTIVQQSDITAAESKITTQNASVKTDLEQQLQGDSVYALPVTFNTGSPTTSVSTSVGSPANNVTVTQTITYTMYGAPKNDLNQLLINDINSQVNTGTQGILSTGLSSANFTASSSSSTSLTMTSTASVGPNISSAMIKQQAAGKKSGEIQSSIKSDPDVTSVTVHFSPFWVSSAPKNVAKITVTVAKPTGSSSNGTNP